MKIVPSTLKAVTESHAGQPLTRLQDKTAVYFRRLLHTALRKIGVPFPEIRAVTGWSIKTIQLDLKWVLRNDTAYTSVRALLYQAEEAERAAREARNTMTERRGMPHD